MACWKCNLLICQNISKRGAQVERQIKRGRGNILGFVFFFFFMTTITSLFAGTTEHIYDNLDRLVETVYIDETQMITTTYTYDKAGNRLSIDRVVGPPPVKMIAVSDSVNTAITYSPDMWILFDVIRGNVSELQDTGTAIDLGNVVCLTNDDDTGTIIDSQAPSTPAAGECFFYLLKMNTFSYGTSSDSKERVASSGDCSAL